MTHTGVYALRESSPIPAAHIKLKPPQAQTCSAGDSAAYERRASSADDVVVVSALRTAVTKVRLVLSLLLLLDTISMT